MLTQYAIIYTMPEDLEKCINPLVMYLIDGNEPSGDDVSQTCHDTALEIIGDDPLLFLENGTKGVRIINGKTNELAGTVTFQLLRFSLEIARVECY